MYEIKNEFNSYSDLVLSLDFSGCGKYMASGSYDNSIGIFDL
jgi:WD40 repeat protein